MRFVPVAVLAVATAFLMSLDAAVVRQASVVGVGNCSVRQFLNLPTDVDFLALGSSRVRAAISTESIQLASGGALRSNFNFARSGLSALRSYFMLRDVMERGARPRFIYMEVDLDALQDTNVSSPIKLPTHVAFMKYADIGVLLELPEVLDSLSRARLLLLTLLDKIRGSIIPMLTLDPLWAPAQRQHAPVASCQARADFDATEPGRLELEALRRQRSVHGQDESATQREFRTGATGSSMRQQELLFVGKVRELARVHGAILVVARPGAAFEPPWSDNAVATIRQDIPEFVQPPGDVVQAAWAGFLDGLHMGPKAREAYSVWLAHQMTTAARP